MTSRTSMLYARIRDRLKTGAAEKLPNVALTISDAVRMLLTRFAKEVLLPAGLAADADAYDAWFRAKEQDALADNRSSTSHREVLDGPCQTKPGPIATGIPLARQGGIPSEGQAETVHHSVSAAKRLCL
jgi:DNA-damage-inducible protein J